MKHFNQKHGQIYQKWQLLIWNDFSDICLASYDRYPNIFHRKKFVTICPGDMGERGVNKIGDKR
jgi:hypothetical protein